MRLKTILLLIVIAASELLAQTGARYLIVTADAYYNAVQPLAQWKQKKGMPVRIAKLSETGSSTTQIQTYIRTAYNTWNPRPEFVLLVGRGYDLPAFFVGMGPNGIYTDNAYGNMSGNCLMELPVGRLPCRTTRQCSIMVAKTLAYERTVAGDTTWYRKGTAVIRDSGDSDSPTYWSDARTVASWARNNGYTAFDTFCSSRNQSAANVVQSVTNGTSFVLYRGTATSNWYTPFAVDPGQTNNGSKLPIICSFTCQTVSLDRNDTMIGDAWLKAGTPQSFRGAVAFVGNVRSASHVALQRSRMTMGFFTGVFAESLLNLGKAVLRGKLQIYNANPYDTFEYMGFNLLGDPELNVRTAVPRALTVNYTPAIPFGQQDYVVVVLRDGVPVGNALVCLKSPSGIYQYGYTSADGRITFSLNPSAEEMMDITVTARNSVPFEGQIRIYNPAAIAEGGRATGTALSIVPNPGQGWFNITGPALSRIDVYSADGRLVRTLRLAGRSARWDASELPAGAYVVRSVTADGWSLMRPLTITR